MSSQSSVITSPSEIQDRLRKRFLDRLSERLKRIRKELVERNWAILRAECRQIRSSGETFGFPELTVLAVSAEAAIPEGEISKARNLPEAKQAVEALVAGIEGILIEHSLGRA